MSQRTSSKLMIALRFALAGAGLAWLISLFGFFHNLNLRAVNELFSLRGGQAQADTSIVIIAVDDESMKSLPTKWPYPRSYFARMVDHLSQAGARLIVFDIEFTEPSREQPAEDDSLARSVARAQNVILAGKVVLDANKRSLNNHYLLKPIPPLLETGAPFALVNVIEDGDGFIRRYMLYQQVGAALYFPLAVQAFLALAPPETGRTVAISGNHVLLAGQRVPTTSGNAMYINFAGPAASFRTYSLASILDDENFDLAGEEDTDIFDQYRQWQTFRDKIVLVGASAEELQDNKYTPFFEYNGQRLKMPGVEMHANALSTLRSGRFLRDLPGWMQVVLLLTASLLSAWLALSLKPFRALPAVVLLIAGFLGLVYGLFVHARWVTDIVAPILSIAFTYVAGLTYQTVVEQKEKNRIRKTFQQYVAPTVVEKMLSTGELPSYGGERKELTVLFSDIRKFTKFSESHEPEVVVSRLQEYLSEMVDVVFRYNGTLDKFVGDELMAVYGAPFHFPDHAERACRTALEMVETLRQIQKRWSQDYNEYFNIGIGINTGKVIVGNLGSKQLFDYTVIGDEVNIGARLEGANKLYETTILISENTYSHVRDTARVRELDLVRLVGRRHPIRIYELRGMAPLPDIEQDLLIDVFAQGLNAYRRRCWADALYSFRRILRYFPTDGPSRIYTQRCLDQLEHPAPDDWNGVYDMEHK
ncbi:MAG: Adenylate cyclase 1 [bacterium ADurb.Bin478]|nr:MAG: Adenylate cyclase 1 [bacterium ADurb.Bin478]